MRLAERLALRAASVPVFGPWMIERHLRGKYGTRVVTPLKARNFLQARRDTAARATEVASLPYILNLDTLNRCNLTCPFCPTGTRQLCRPGARLSLDRARAVIGAIKPWVLEARLYNWGEPFLNADIFEITRYAHDAGLYTVLNSNLSLRVDRLGDRVVESGLDVLSVSMDGIEQRTLEQYRRGADCDLVLENVRRIVEARGRRGSRTPRIEIAFLVFRHNEHEVPRLAEMREALGVDAFYPRRAFIYHESFRPQAAEFQPQQALFAGTCKFLYTELTVEADGAISPCCTNTSTRWDVGTVEDLRDLRAFWNSPAFQAMRQYFAAEMPGDAPGSGVEGGILCRYCDAVARPGQKGGALSPVSPGLVAEGKTYDHGLDGRGEGV